MTEMCPYCNRKSHASLVEFQRERLFVKYYCPKCKREFVINYECRVCNHNPKYYKEHCNNDHVFSISHKCKLRDSGVIE